MRRRRRGTQHIKHKYTVFGRVPFLMGRITVHDYLDTWTCVVFAVLLRLRRRRRLSFVAAAAAAVVVVTRTEDVSTIACAT